MCTTISVWTCLKFQRTVYRPQVATIHLSCRPLSVTHVNLPCRRGLPPCNHQPTTSCLSIAACARIAPTHVLTARQLSYSLNTVQVLSLSLKSSSWVPGRCQTLQQHLTVRDTTVILQKLEDSVLVFEAWQHLGQFEGHEVWFCWLALGRSPSAYLANSDGML